MARLDNLRKAYGACSIHFISQPTFNLFLFYTYKTPVPRRQMYVILVVCQPVFQTLAIMRRPRRLSPVFPSCRLPCVSLDVASGVKCCVRNSSLSLYRFYTLCPLPVILKYMIFILSGCNHPGGRGRNEKNCLQHTRQMLPPVVPPSR